MKTITFTFINSLIDEELFHWTMPYDPRKAIFGFYSEFYKTQMEFAKQEIRMEGVWIKSSVRISSKKTDRIIFHRKGFELDLPKDFKPKDIDIVLLHLEAKRLSLTN